MINYNPVTKEKGECLIVGRAATAIYLILSELKQNNKYVLVPANICYAAVFPIISAGLKPLFCDVDRYSGNVNQKSIIEVLNKDVIAAIIPHMYGNPVQSIKDIYDILSSNNTFMIEDCASLMTNNISETTPGTVGDYVIYSTGYSKTIDVGFGGLLFSKKYDLSEIEKKLIKLPLISEEFKNETSLFSKIYRILRNQRHDSKLAKDFYSSLNNSFKDNFLFRLDDEKIEIVLNELNTLDEVIRIRDYKYSLYKEKLMNNYEIYSFNEHSVPWRFNLFINDKDYFVEYCLKHNLPVSDWYPCVTPIFGDEKIYNEALWHEKHIVNFPLMISDSEIFNICNIVLNYNVLEK